MPRRPPPIQPRIRASLLGVVNIPDLSLLEEEGIIFTELTTRAEPVDMFGRDWKPR